jgi:hypothetical protein
MWSAGVVIFELFSGRWLLPDIVSGVLGICMNMLRSLSHPPLVAVAVAVVVATAIIPFAESSSSVRRTDTCRPSAHACFDVLSHCNICVPGQVDGNLAPDSGDVAVTFNDGGDLSSGTELSKSDMAAISAVAAFGGYADGEPREDGVHVVCVWRVGVESVFVWLSVCVRCICRGACCCRVAW